MPLSLKMSTDMTKWRPVHPNKQEPRLYQWSAATSDKQIGIGVNPHTGTTAVTRPDVTVQELRYPHYIQPQMDSSKSINVLRQETSAKPPL